MLTVIRNLYEPFYKTNDKGHSIKHADDVFNVAIELNKKLGHPYSEDIIAISSYIHDIFANSRKNHHQLAFDYVMGRRDKLLERLTQPILEEIAYAVLQHRASYKGEMYGLLSEIISSADRGKPDFKKSIVRSMDFTTNKYPNEDLEELVIISKFHLKDKYGSKGYANYPKLYSDFFNDEIESFKNKIDNITNDDIASVYFI